MNVMKAMEVMEDNGEHRSRSMKPAGPVSSQRALRSHP